MERKARKKKAHFSGLGRTGCKVFAIKNTTRHLNERMIVESEKCKRTIKFQKRTVNRGVEIFLAKPKGLTLKKGKTRPSFAVFFVFRYRNDQNIQ